MAIVLKLHRSQDPFMLKNYWGFQSAFIYVDFIYQYLPYWK